jgi:hypothetical protein
MCCGFGAVVLLVMLLHGDLLANRKESAADLQSQADRLERQVRVGREHLVSLQNSLEKTDRERLVTEGLSRQVLEQIVQIEEELGVLQKDSLAKREHIKALQSDLLATDEKAKRIGAEQKEELARGQQVRMFLGQGDRQYLTGLRLGGKRILLLVDISASMLDETILNIILRRNLAETAKRSAPKWQRTLRTVEWLLANLPVESNLQIVLFNTKARFALKEYNGKWIAITDSQVVDRMLIAVRQVVPEGGTSLINAFELAMSLKPRPDNILLLTDGLPTQGKQTPSKTTVSGDERLRLFQKAIRLLPKSIPVNTILFPMEGDPMAAVSFWQLAIETNGSFLTPTRDWP